MKEMVEGIVTERIEVPLSARASIRFNPEFDFNGIDEKTAATTDEFFALTSFSPGNRD
jgi:hypothetical protein